ncbi:hypothetical protein LTR65_006439 [Meristemomyces frigidus]
MPVAGLEAVEDAELLPLAGLEVAPVAGLEAVEDAELLPLAGLEIALARLVTEVPIVTVEEKLRVMVERTVAVLDALVDPGPATELPLLFTGSTPLEMLAVGVLPPDVAVGVNLDVVTDVKVSGQIVVETATTEV